jgi:hypothetical protein
MGRGKWRMAIPAGGKVADYRKLCSGAFRLPQNRIELAICSNRSRPLCGINLTGLNRPHAAIGESE